MHFIQFVSPHLTHKLGERVCKQILNSQNYWNDLYLCDTYSVSLKNIAEEFVTYLSDSGPLRLISAMQLSKFR